jgi:hypothetical protein
VWVHIAGSKANMGEVKAKAAIFCYPLLGARGFVVRLLESRKLMVVYSISVVDDRLLRHARILASDDMRITYGHSPRVVRDMADEVRNMYAAIPGVPMDDFMVRLDPLASGGVPERLEAVRSDDFGGELILDFPTVCSAGADLSATVAAPHAPLPPTLSAPAPALPARSPDPVRLRARAEAFAPPSRTLPCSRAGGLSKRALAKPAKSWSNWARRFENKKHAIFVPSGAAKREASALRFEKIRGCTSVAEYERAWDLCGGHPRLRWYTDFNNDILHGLVRFRNPSSFTHPAPLRALDYPANQLAPKIKRRSKLAA